MASYDGSITIDTKIDSKGLTDGVKNMGSKLGSLVTTAKTIGLTLIAAFTGAAISTSLAGIAGKFNLFASSFGSSIWQLNDAWQTLEGSIMNLIATALVPLIPYVIQIINWFSHLVQYITIIVGALWGLDKTIGDIARHSNNLAAFDKINTLANNFQQAKSPPPLTIPQEMLDKIAQLKQSVGEILKPLMDVWNQFFVPFGHWIATVAFPWLIDQFNALGKFAKDHPKDFQMLAGEFLLIAVAVLAMLSPLALVALLIGLIIVLVVLLITHWNQLGITIWQLGQIVTMSLGAAFDITLKFIEDRFTRSFNFMFGFLKGIINSMIWLLNRFLTGVSFGINSIITGANFVGKLLPGYTPAGLVPTVQVPYLANGAVIPPNSAFMAVLGDQKSGTNIEAPADLIRSIVREEISNSPVNISFNGSLSALAKVMKPEIDRENVRVGNNLIKRTGQVSIS